MKKNSNKGFTLIELLIVVAIIGIIVAIAIPNLLNAIQRAKQKRTMADMRSAGTACEAYAVDFNHYPAAAAVTLPSGISMPTTTFGAEGDTTQMSGKVAPTYIRVLPLVDGWSSFFLYTTGSSNQQHYAIASYGKNGLIDTISTVAETTDFNTDILFGDGQFLIYPAGAQH